MKFSVLIANYNNGNFFADCHKSLLGQSYPDWEAVIIDDCSTDNSVDIIMGIIGDDQRFKLFFNEKNSGVGTTKARLIELATGEICGFVDPDDAILPDAISDAVTAFGEDGNTALTYSKFIKCDENLSPVSENISARQVLNGDKYFFNCPVVINHFVCFRKSIYEMTAKMDTTKKIAEDQDLYLKMYEKGLAKLINKANYLYRQHGGGISQNDNKRKSYEYWSEVIFSAMKRRNLKSIHGEVIPDVYPGMEEVFKLLEYQNRMPYRIRKKLKIMLQNFF